MGDKDLEKVLANISASEKEAAVKKNQMDRLREHIQKQNHMIEELQSVISDQKEKIDRMFDVPADVEELKRMVSKQRTDLKEKDHSLEMAFGRIAELEQDLIGSEKTQEIINKKFDESFTQMGDIRAELTTKRSEIQLKENEIHNLSSRIQEFEKVIAEDKKIISRLQDEVRQKDLLLIEEKGKIEAELKQQIFAERDDAFNKIKDLETQLLEKDLNTKEELADARRKAHAYDELKTKYENLIRKFDEVQNKMVESEKNYEELMFNQSSVEEFKKKSEPILKNFDKLRKFMEREPIFKIFFIVLEIGNMNVENLAKAVGVPLVTCKKYVNEFIDSKIMEIDENTQKIHLI
jgi:DNA repair exonuclease SbcCD ATPase subunit